MTQIDQMTQGIYRLSSISPQKRLSFNQFLIDEEQPALIHTGFYPQYADIRQAVAQILDPARLAYIIVPHFEADECGGMGRFVAEAPNAVLVCSAVGARINLSQWEYAGPVRGVQEGELIELGKHQLRFLETPHVHHWDSLMAFEETTRSSWWAVTVIRAGPSGLGYGLRNMTGGANPVHGDPRVVAGRLRSGPSLTGFWKYLLRERPSGPA